MNTTINLIAAAVIAFVSGTGGWATLQLIINRRGRKAEAARTQAEAEKNREESKRIDAERRKALQEIQSDAQKLALESSREAVSRISEDLGSCRRDLTETRSELVHNQHATEGLIDAFEAYLEAEDSVEARRVARLAIRQARRALNFHADVRDNPAP